MTFLYDHAQGRIQEAPSMHAQFSRYFCSNKQNGAMLRLQSDGKNTETALQQDG